MSATWKIEWFLHLMRKNFDRNGVKWTWNETGLYQVFLILAQKKFKKRIRSSSSCFSVKGQSNVCVQPKNIFFHYKNFYAHAHTLSSSCMVTSVLFFVIVKFNRNKWDVRCHKWVEVWCFKWVYVHDTKSCQLNAQPCKVAKKHHAKRVKKKNENVGEGDIEPAH